MILNNIVIIEKLLSGDYFIFVQQGTTIVKGEIPKKLVPDNYETLEKLPLEDWKKYLSIKSKDIGEKPSDEITAKKLKRTTLLTEKDGKFYRINTTVSLPKEIIDRYLTYENINKEEIEALDNFWYWTCLNEPKIREMLYGWLEKGKWTITKEGMIVAYRNVIPIDKWISSGKIENVNEAYFKIKKNKKSPKNFYLNGSKILPMKKGETSVHDAYVNYNNSYTHSYNASPRLFYRLNEETVMDRKLADDSNAQCSSGK